MERRHRVAVTGMGVVSPIGNDLETFRRHLLEGVSGVGTITLFDPASLPTRIAAEVKIPSKRLNFRDRKVAFALMAAQQAMADAGTEGGGPGGAGGGMQAGLSIGIGLELFSMDDLVAYRRPGWAPPASSAQRLTFLQTPSDLCVHLIAKQHGLQSPPLTHVSACAAGADAIGSAYRLVATGRRTWMLAGGSDSMINPLGVGGFCKLGALSRNNDAPQQASRPFDRLRDGFVLGEGAGFLVLESREVAEARGARIYAEVAGYGASLDAYSISDPHPQGQGAYLAMKGALEGAGIGPEQVDCINAHGTSTPKNDVTETLAIKRLLGGRAAEIPICATKSLIGHTISAAGAIEAIAAILCMHKGWAHPTRNLEHPDPECDLDYVAGGARAWPQRYVLSNSFGFGGHNASLLFEQAGWILEA